MLRLASWLLKPFCMYPSGKSRLDCWFARYLLFTLSQPYCLPVLYYNHIITELLNKIFICQQQGSSWTVHISACSRLLRVQRYPSFLLKQTGILLFLKIHFHPQPNLPISNHVLKEILRLSPAVQEMFSLRDALHQRSDCNHDL